MMDKENNFITLAECPNPNVLVWGRSGQGKTFFFCREIEREVRKGKKVLIIDYSGSYTSEELEKNQIKIETIKVFNLAKTPFYWFSYYETEKEFSANLSDSLASVLNIDSYFQKKWLRKAMLEHLLMKKQFNILEFLKVLEDLYSGLLLEENHRDDLENIQKLLARFSPYETLERFYIKRRVVDKKIVPVTILQISELPEHEKRFVAKLLIELFWKEVRQRKHSHNIIVLDEIQFLLEKDKGAFFGIMREGRKFGLKAYMGTQFISAHKKEVIESLLQAGNILIFKPTARDMSFSAGVIDEKGKKSWRKILGELEVGEAVIMGNYFLNNGKRRITDAIVCRI